MQQQGQGSTDRPNKALKEKVAAEGRTMLVIGFGCWGKDATVAKALKMARYHGGTTGKFILWDCPAGAWVDDYGAIRWKLADGEIERLGRIA